MAKSQNDLIYDAAFAYIRTRATKMTICNGAPTTYAQATDTSANMLAETTTPIGSSEYTVTDGDVSGRKLITPAKTLTVSKTGSANHIVFVSSSDGIIIFMTTVSSQTITAAASVNVAGFDFEILDVA